MRSASAIRAVEEDLGEVRVAVHLAQGSDVDAGAPEVEPEGRDAAVLGYRGVVAREQEPEARVRAPARPHLLTVHPPLVAVASRVESPARSDPAPGSENSWHQISSPFAIFGSQRAHCSARPWASSVGPTSSRPTRYG